MCLITHVFLYVSRHKLGGGDVVPGRKDRHHMFFWSDSGLYGRAVSYGGPKRGGRNQFYSRKARSHGGSFCSPSGKININIII